MLAIKATGDSLKCSTANIIPCRIHHDGPTKVTKRYWTPETESDGTQTSYFRGRKLRGRVINIPAGYRGVAAKTTKKTLEPAPKPKREPQYSMEADGMEMEEEEDEPPESVKILEEVASFDNVVVWGHDQVPTSDDPFVRGIEEWIGFAEAIHGKQVDLQPTTEDAKATNS